MPFSNSDKGTVLHNDSFASVTTGLHDRALQQLEVIYMLFIYKDDLILNCLSVRPSHFAKGTGFPILFNDLSKSLVVLGACDVYNVMCMSYICEYTGLRIYGQIRDTTAIALVIKYIDIYLCICSKKLQRFCTFIKVAGKN